jgi:hypothetical protein
MRRGEAVVSVSSAKQVPFATLTKQFEEVVRDWGAINSKYPKLLLQVF